ncbi:MAG TPA: alpha/beta fold hydrolase [Caulobacteraceae bacterium]|nr:alpha/beta fold hydrolase [Caulobacteraceae bacterium]
MTLSIPDVRLRLGGPADADAIQALTRAAYQPWVAVIGREPLPMQSDYVAAIAQHRFDLAFRGDDLIGLIETRGAPDHLLVVNVAVAPAWQGQGLGRRLMAEAERLARAAGLPELRLYTNAAFARNLRLYRDLGFAVARRDPGPRGVTVHMARRLDTPPRRLLFLPGAGADPAFWRPLGERLPGAWTKRYFGWPGLGDQPPDPAVNSIADLVALVEAELDPGPADLLAQSMGCVVALQVALRHPEKVRRLVLTAASGGVDVADLARFDWRANYRRQHPNAAPWITEERIDLTAEIPRIDSPALLLWGDSDPISPVAVGEQFAALLPDARLHVARGAGHDLAQTHAPDLAPLVEAHLR